jgi:uncharacterized protein YkwD
LTRSISKAVPSPTKAQVTGRPSTSHAYVPPVARASTPPSDARAPQNNSTPKAAPTPKPAAKPALPVHTVSVPPAPEPVSVGAPGIPSIANAVLALLNQERTQNGLKALPMNSHLISSAHAHNLAMYRTNTFAHQVSGEAGLGARVSATGLGWTAAGENIATSSVTSAASAQSLEAMMYNEKPGDDGHRQNILSTQFTYVGIDVISTGGGKMWVTEDFAN